MRESWMYRSAFLRWVTAMIRAVGARRLFAGLCTGMLAMLVFTYPTVTRAASADIGSPEQELTSLEKRWWDSIKNHDKALLETVLADDFMGVDNGGEPPTTKSQWVAWAMAFQLKSYVLEKLDMRIAGDTAIVAVHYSTRVVLAGVEKDDHGVDMDVFVRRNGRWQALGTGEVHLVTKK